MKSKFDAGEVWEKLTPQQRNCVGVATVLLMASFVAEHFSPANDVAMQRWLHARDTALHYLRGIPLDAHRLIAGPDLSLVNMRACRLCGCTDHSACEDGCYWVEEDLCSKCEHQAAGHA
ncbi:MAG TPA: hypothetical protein VEQ62_18070 [Stellaceae bacterium]|jgi:hypothetical protein|nr:hypothetical protein [Stellaceae bacterium]